MEHDARCNAPVVRRVVRRELVCDARAYGHPRVPMIRGHDVAVAVAVVVGVAVVAVPLTVAAVLSK